VGAFDATMAGVILAAVSFGGLVVYLRSNGGASYGRSSVLATHLLTVSGVAAFSAVWCLLSAYWTDGLTRIPSPLATGRALAAMIGDGSLVFNLVASVIRIAVGFSLAAVVGVSAGWLAGTFLVVNKLVLPTNSFLRYIPPTAFVTLLIVYFGIGEVYKYAVVFTSVVFFIVQMTVDAVEDIDQRYKEMGLLSGMDSAALLRHVVLPGTLPRVVDILRVNLSGAWTFLVAAEVVGADGGLGHLIAVSQRFGRIENLYAAIIVFGFIGILTDAFLKYLARRCFRWSR
jgi:NitT/TauT family transport system permease protein